MISVIITTYKRPIEILKRAINSVILQSYKDIEILIVNDNPNDYENSDKIKKYVDEQKALGIEIKYLSYEKNMGSNFARNFGLSKSKGEYISYLDDDDVWYENKLYEQLMKIEANENIALVTCYFNIIKDNKKVGVISSDSYKNSDIKYLLENNYVGGTSFPLLRKKCVMEIGGFDENMKSCQEYELWIRLRKKYSFSVVEKVLGEYYISSDSTFKRNLTRYYYDDMYIINKNYDLFKRNKYHYNIHLNVQAMFFLKNGYPKYYFKYKWKALCVRPFSINNVYFLYKILSKVKVKR